MFERQRVFTIIRGGDSSSKRMIVERGGREYDPRGRASCLSPLASLPIELSISSGTKGNLSGFLEFVKQIRARIEKRMNTRKPRRDSDVLPSKFGHKELLFKFLVIGDYGVGKTALVRRYTEGKFTSNYKITIGADFAIKTLDWDPFTKINLQLWDVAGHERFGYITRVYYKYAVAAALVFDISRIATFQSMKRWLTDLREKVTLPDGSNIPVVLLANKCDIPCPVVPADQIAKFCKENDIGAWYVTSAKENTNVDTAMRYLVEHVLKTKFKVDGGIRDSVRLREKPTIQEKSTCCKS